jgi:fermentation-respiration switch protein FrsA (DUF1100 family)
MKSRIQICANLRNLRIHTFSQHLSVNRWSWRLARIAACVYLGLALILSFLQTQLIFPGAATQGRPDSIVRPFDGNEIVTLKAHTGDTVTALFGPALTPDGQPYPDGKHRPTLLYFYGNGMCLADCVDELETFRRRGFKILVPDFIGYGMSTGKPSEAGVYATADACFDHLMNRPDIDAKKIVPLGWSLGAAAAIHLASTRDVPCVVTISAFTSMADLARRLFPILPTGLILKHHFENEKKLHTIRVPIFLAHGTRDSIIPFAMSQKLAAAAAGPVTKYDVQDGDHNDVFDVGGTGLLDGITAFVERATSK